MDARDAEIAALRRELQRIRRALWEMGVDYDDLVVAEDPRQPALFDLDQLEIDYGREFPEELQ